MYTIFGTLRLFFEREKILISLGPKMIKILDLGRIMTRQVKNTSDFTNQYLKNVTLLIMTSKVTSGRDSVNS